MLFCGVTTVFKATSVGLTNATSCAILLSSMSSISGTVFPVTIVLYRTTDTGDFATAFEATSIRLFDAACTMCLVALGAVHFGAQVVMLIVLNGAVHFAFSHVFLFVSVSRNCATSCFVMLVSVTTMLEASRLTLFDAFGAMSFVMMLSVNNHSLLEFLRIAFNSCTGFIFVNSSTRCILTTCAHSFVVFQHLVCMCRTAFFAHLFIVLAHSFVVLHRALWMTRFVMHLATMLEAMVSFASFHAFMMLEFFFNFMQFSFYIATLFVHHWVHRFATSHH